jgi:hypothetical protein
MQSSFDSSQYEIFFLNIEIAAALWVHIAAFEHTLRIFINDKLSKVYGRNDWWNIQGLLSQKDFKDVRKVTRRLESRDPKVATNQLIENLSFSFWVELLGKRYLQTIWMKILKFFTVYPGRREDFYNKAREIRNLRNSIAHHGPILRRNLIRDHAYLGELTAILDPHLALEVEKRSRVLDLLLDARLVGSGGGI